jgi:hypothetical protein
MGSTSRQLVAVTSWVRAETVHVPPDESRASQSPVNATCQPSTGRTTREGTGGPGPWPPGPCRGHHGGARRPGDGTWRIEEHEGGLHGPGGDRAGRPLPLGAIDRGESPQAGPPGQGHGVSAVGFDPLPPLWGITEGATPRPSSPVFVRSRESPEPPGPASETTIRGVAVECLVRRR